MKLINLQINFKYFFFLFSCSVFYLFYNNQYNSIDVVKISLLFFLVLYPIFNYKIYHREKIIIIPYLHIYCLLFFIFYCLGFFLSPEFIFFDSLINSNLINILLLSIIFFYLGYFLLNVFVSDFCCFRLGTLQIMIWFSICFKKFNINYLTKKPPLK